MCTVLLPRGGEFIAAKYIMSYHIQWYKIEPKNMKEAVNFI